MRSHAELGRGVDDAERLKEGDAEPSDGWEKGVYSSSEGGYVSKCMYTK